jgi:hypothetical protein
MVHETALLGPLRGYSYEQKKPKYYCYIM